MRNNIVDKVLLLYRQVTERAKTHDYSEQKIEKCRILGVNIAVIDMEQTVELLQRNKEQWRGEYICVSNAHTTVTAYEDKEYLNIQNSAVLALPDGKPLSVVSKTRGFKNAARVAGPDLMEEMFKNASNGMRYYFYGSTPETLKELKKVLQMRYPGLKIAGMYSPPFRPLTAEEDLEVIKRINDAKPDIVWVGLGAPKQEIWMHQHQQKINAIMIGVGAGFDYLSGQIKRAPKWMQHMGLEWLSRLCQDPKRLWKRYLRTNFKFILYVASENKALRKK